MTYYGSGYGGYYYCCRCGHNWCSRTLYKDPERCPNCGTVEYWYSDEDTSYKKKNEKRRGKSIIAYLLGW